MRLLTVIGAQLVHFDVHEEHEVTVLFDTAHITEFLHAAVDCDWCLAGAL